jgi:Kef-type K+ transport system membrane component KefB
MSDQIPHEIKFFMNLLFIESPKALAWVPILIISAYFVKVIPMLWIGQSLGLRRSMAGGILLSSPRTLVVVAASIGQRLGAITTDFQDAILVVVYDHFYLITNDFCYHS